MTTVSDIINTPLSGLNHIDALLDKGPDWNFQTTTNQNVIFYTFSVASGTETSKTGHEAFSASQQAGARTMLTYLQQITGIEFRETGNGTQAQVHLANLDLAGTYTTGLCSWGASYSEFDPLTVYRANAYVYLDNDFRWGATNGNLQPGTEGYETLLHEMGHALGLKHSFFEYTGTNEAQIVLPDAEDNTTNTLMSYDRVGGNHSTFSPYDIAALNWLYGGDGLRGELGINSTTGARYITGSFKAETLTGTAFNDTLQGYGGNDMIDGAEGTDTVVFSGARSAYTLQELADGSLAVVGVDGTTTLRSVEQLRFADMSVTRASVADTVAPAAPVILVTQNAAGYARGSMPTMTGAAEAGSTVSVYINQQLVATALADANGLWSARSSLALADNFNYRATATAKDVSGNVSAASAASIFHVDTIAPTTPSLNATLIAGGNQPVFAGSGEVGTLIQIAKITADNVIEIGRTTVGANGQWQLNSAPLPNGDYQVRAASSDAADNGTSSEQTITLTINNALNQTGTAGNDTFTMAPGNSAVEGGAGMDVAVYSGVSDSFVLARGVYGFTVRDAQGSVDNLINVERIKFDDTMVALDINGGAGQVYRLYQAAFDRVPDIAGLAFWIKAADAGTSLLDIAKSFSINKEYIDLYANTSNAQFVTKLYEHVLDRPPEGAGYEFWLNNLTSGATDRDTVLASFSESPENQAQVIGSISNGIEYPFA